MSNLSQGSPAYNEWVHVENVRLDLTLYTEIFSRLQPSLVQFSQKELTRLTAENKKRRLLFARGRKEPLRKKLCVRW